MRNSSKLTSILATSFLFVAAHAQATNLITNGDFSSFTSGSLNNGQVCTSNPGLFSQPACSATDWTGTYQIAKGVSAFNVPTTNGVDTLVIQSNPSVDSLATQDVILPGAGSYALSFDAATRGDSAPQTLFVEVDDVTVATFDKLSTNWALETLNINFATGGSHNITLTGLANSRGNESAFVQNVSLTANAPEPASLALIGLGIGTIGLLRRKAA